MLYLHQTVALQIETSIEGPSEAGAGDIAGVVADPAVQIGQIACRQRGAAVIRRT